MNNYNNEYLINEMGRSGLQSIASSWDDLFRCNFSMRFFHTFDWYDLYTTHLATNPDAVSIFAASDDGEKIFLILPYVKKSFRFLRAEIVKLESIFHPHSILSDVISSGNDCNVSIRKFIRLLRNNDSVRWDILHIRNVLEDSLLSNHDMEIPLSICIPSGKTSSYFSCDPSTPHFEKLTSHFKRNLRRHAKRASEIGPVSYQYVNEKKDLIDAFNQFLRIESSGWKGIQGTHSAIALNKNIESFYKGLIERFSEVGVCQINLMKIGSEYVAGHFCLIDNGILNILKIGYDHEYKKVSPGNLLLLDLIKKCTADPSIKTINLITGPEWSKRWRPADVKQYDVYYFNRTLTGYLSCLMLQFKRFIKSFRN